MAEILGYQFDRVFAEPIELYRKVDTIADRDAIPTGKRYQGMLCYVVSENEDYQLRSGVTNGDWIGSGIGNFFNKLIDDTDNISQGVTNLFMNTIEQTKLGHITVTQAIDLDQLELDVSALGGGVIFRGVWSPSGGVFPGGGTSAIGDLYIANDSGTIDGVSFVAGDGIISTVLNASTTVFSNNWAKTESTSDVTSVVGLTGVVTKTSLLNALNVEDGATADMTDAEIVTAINNELTVTTWQNPLTKEQVLDYIGEAIAAGTQTNISVTYNDASDSIDFDVAPNLDAATLDGLDSTQFIRSDVADTKTAGDLTFDDNVKIALGTGGAESEISSDGLDTNINLKGGDLKIQNNGVDIIIADRITGQVSTKTFLANGLNLSSVNVNESRVDGYGLIGNRSNYYVTTGGGALIFGTGSVHAELNRARMHPSGNWSFGNTNDIYTIDVTGTGRFTGDLIVPSDPYSSDWNGDNSVPTKNDVYDKIESLPVPSNGSFSPTIAPATSGSYTYTTFDCNYNKIGDIWFLTLGFSFTGSTSPVGAIEITLNLPGSPTTTGLQYLNIGRFSDMSPTQPSYSQMIPTVESGKITFTDYEGTKVTDMDLSSTILTMSGMIATD